MLTQNRIILFESQLSRVSSIPLFHHTCPILDDTILLIDSAECFLPLLTRLNFILVSSFTGGFFLPNLFILINLLVSSVCFLPLFLSAIFSTISRGMILPLLASLIFCLCCSENILPFPPY